MSYANNIWLIKFDQILDFQQLSSLLHYLVMTKISEALDQYGHMQGGHDDFRCKVKQKYWESHHRGTTFIQRRSRQRHLLLAARKLRTCGSPAASMAGPRPGKPPRRHHWRTTSSPPPPQLQKISRITSRALKKCWLFRLPPPQAKIKRDCLTSFGQSLFIVSTG